MNKILAHVLEDQSRLQTLKEHAEGTAELARQFGMPFGADSGAYAAGMLHDCGKAAEAVQKRLRGAPLRADHSTAGALEAVKLFNDLSLAACIAGHHAGLPDYGSRKSCVFGDGTLWGRLKAVPGRDIGDYSAWRREIMLPDRPRHPEWARMPHDVFFYVHMLYSCLVDADFLDTECFMQDGEAKRGKYASLEALSERFDDGMRRKIRTDTPVNRKRTEILQTLIAQAERPRGLYTLTVPTGGGKTLSSMAFALRHALRHDMRRIIYIIPYQSIIEQTAAVFAEMVGEENVLAHYSNADFWSKDDTDEAANRKRLAAENWDAPVIVTTSVQFFESFFSNRSSHCRKLHNVADSVLIFDEAQTLPLSVLRPCLYAVCQLVRHYGCTGVLCTATQPALRRLLSDPLLYPGASILELAPDPAGLHAFFRRVEYVKDGVLNDDALSERLRETPQALCVVNRIRHAQTLYDLLPDEGRYCLTTRLTPRDRRRWLTEIRERLAEGLPCRVIATSLIEAGVDVDFPTVYRELAGLDSVIQAAGRCNREGKKPAEESIVHLFEPADSPPKYLAKQLAAAQRVLQRETDIASPSSVERYFAFLLYTLKDDASLDKNNILGQINSMSMASIAQTFRIIDEESCSVIVPCDENAEDLEALRTSGPSRALLRRLGRDSVSLRRSVFGALMDIGQLEPVGANLAILGNPSLYHSRTGLEADVEMISDTSLIY